MTTKRLGSILSVFVAMIIAAALFYPPSSASAAATSCCADYKEKQLAPDGYICWNTPCNPMIRVCCEVYKPGDEE